MKEKVVKKEKDVEMEEKKQEDGESQPPQQSQGHKMATKKVLNSAGAIETCPSFSRQPLCRESIRRKYRLLSAAHVESFDFFSEVGLERAVSDLTKREYDLLDSSSVDNNDGQQRPLPKSVDAVRYWIENVRLVPPSWSPGVPSSSSSHKRRSSSTPLTPRTCREMRSTYAGLLVGDFCFQSVTKRLVSSSDNNNKGEVSSSYEVSSSGRVVRLSKRMGAVPIMVMSSKCHLHGRSSRQLVSWREEPTEFGGYFVINGNERLMRLLQMPRRHHPMAVRREAFTKKDARYTNAAVTYRATRADETSSTVVVHYLTDGTATVSIRIRKQEFLVPAVLWLRALSSRNETDEVLYRRIAAGSASSSSSSNSSGMNVQEAFLRPRVELLFRESAHLGLATSDEALQFLGERFRSVFTSELAASTSNSAVGRYLMDRYLFIHLSNDEDKLNCLCLCLHKLYALVSGACGVDNPDSLSHQEMLLPGHFLTAFVKEKMDEGLTAIHGALRRDHVKDFSKFVGGNVTEPNYWSRLFERSGLGQIGNKVTYVLTTGNVISTTGVGLMQDSGLTVVAERLNFWRYCAHFRSVHRGAFFAEMKSTAVRKLLPDQWGFLCPVHTPDGAPCGLLSHLALKCQILATSTSNTSTTNSTNASIATLVDSIGVVRPFARPGDLVVCLDGRVLGYGTPTELEVVTNELRRLKTLCANAKGNGNGNASSSVHVKVNGTISLNVHKQLQFLEVANLVPSEDKGGMYAGLFLFSNAARMIRPVLYLHHQEEKSKQNPKPTFIGPMEQLCLEIACLASDVTSSTTHLELDPTNPLSLVASLTPFSDYNQSPRNMYQCQMSKQTMGTPVQSFAHRTDNKYYRLLHPQAPVCQTRRHAEHEMDQYPNGTNAVVAVVSYTGFDMEDAMILNKASYERGFGHGCVYKTKVLRVEDESKALLSSSASSVVERGRFRFRNRFGTKPAHVRAKELLQRQRQHSNQNNPNNGEESVYDPDVIADGVGPDGLPEVGSWLSEGDPYYVVVDDLTAKHKVGVYKEFEKCCVERVTLIGSTQALSSSTTTTSNTNNNKAKVVKVKEPPCETATVTLRVPRNPVIGDKFSSRHGQKGILSFLWPQQDMPFTETGVTPDIIINPHAFPSRMTIGMLIESMAAKSGALHGLYQDSTPFSFHETGSQLAVDYFGEQLQAAGYNYYGSEPLYSGVSGCRLQADLYIGVVYYQRLRHMVADKAQVRATGKVNPLTRQPIKGRKKGGGIRLGEMERDSLLSHGAAFCLRDRLLNSSDKHRAFVCRRCGDLLAPTTVRDATLSAGQSRAQLTNQAQLKVVCRSPTCQGTKDPDSHDNEDGNDPDIEVVELPYVYRYLVNELAAMNIKLKMELDG